MLIRGSPGMIKLGLLGANISHSRSKEMYESLIGDKVDYKLIDIPLGEDVPDIKNYFGDMGLMGLSITYPYKKYFLEKVTIENDLIKSLAAINCIEKRGDDFFATNTDYLAALHLLTHNYLGMYSHFILLGSGNMAQVFETAFKKLKVDFVSFNRRKDGDLNKLDYQSIIKSKKTLIINTCSRQFEFSPRERIDCGFWDMNYSFEPHQKLEQNGLVYHEGLDLLLEQAKFALKFWKMGHLIKNL